MRTKPAVIGACASLLAGAWLAGGPATPAHAAPPPTLLLYPRAPSDPDDVRALVDLRRKLRADGRFDVLTFDPASAALIRAAGDAHRAELLSGPMTAESDRLALTRALGAAFYVVVSKADGRGKSDLFLAEAAPGAHHWAILGRKTDDAARAVEEQTADALQHPVPVAAQPLPVRLPTVAAVKPTTPTVSPMPVVPTPSPAVALKPTLPPITPSIPAAAPPVTVAARPAPAAPPVIVAQVPVTPRLPILVPNAPAPPAAKQSDALPSPPIIGGPGGPPTAPATVPTSPAVAPPTPPPSVAEAPPQTVIAPSSTPIPAPARVVTDPTPYAPPPDDLSGIKTQLRQGDDQLAQGDFVAAIAVYRDAINGAPLSVVPRMKLAQAYLEADMRDKALDEARRALQIAPDSPAVQQFLTRLDAQSGTADGAVARFSAQATTAPQDPTAHLELGDALWNNGTVDQAETEYKTAQSLAGPGTPAARSAAAHLARLYAAQRRYGDSLTALKDAGPGGYALALGIVQSRADTLSATLDSAQDQFSAGKSTHADFYKTAGDVRAQAQGLADFVIQVAPPSAFKLSHLYRVQATHLLAQQAAVLVTYIETSDPAQADRAARLGKSAQTEMLMAHAAEQKLGLWGGGQTEAKN